MTSRQQACCVLIGSTIGTLYGVNADLEPGIQYKVEVRFHILTIAPGIKSKLQLMAGSRIAGSIGIVEVSRERHMQKGHDEHMDASGASDTIIFSSPGIPGGMG